MILNNDTSRIWKPSKKDNRDRSKDRNDDGYHDGFDGDRGYE